MSGARVIDVTMDDLRAMVREELARVLGGGDFLTVQEAAQLARVHPATVRTWIREGRIAPSRIGRSVRVRKSDVEALLAPEDAGVGKLLDMARRGA